MPGWPRMTLCGVVYHSGQTVRTGHYTAACRGSGGRYWMYDDVGRQSAVLINQDISTVMPTQVHVLMYCRTDLLGEVSRSEVRFGSSVGGIGGHGEHGAAGASNFGADAGPDVRSVTGSGVAAGSQDAVRISAHGSGGGHVGARGERRKKPSTLETPSKRARLALSPGLVERSGSGASGIQPALETPSRRLRAKTSVGSVGSPGAQVCEESSAVETPSRRLRSKTSAGSVERSGLGEPQVSSAAQTPSRRLRGNASLVSGGSPGSGARGAVSQVTGSTRRRSVKKTRPDAEEDAEAVGRTAQNENERSMIPIGDPASSLLSRAHDELQSGAAPRSIVEEVDGQTRRGLGRGRGRGRSGRGVSEASDSGLACSAGAESAASPVPAIAGVGVANEAGASGTGHVVGGGRGSRAGRGPSGRAAGGVRGGRGRRAPDDQAEMPRREEAGVRRSARIRAQGTGEQLPKSQPSAAGATIRGGILSRPARGSSEVVSATQPSASGTAVSPARTRQRIVCGFGNERVPDLAQFQRERVEEQLQRGVQRVREGVRGRMVDREGNELDRSQGGAFSLGSGRGRGGGT